MERDNHIFLKNGSKIFCLRRPDTQIGLHRVVNVRFFAQAISFVLKRRALRNDPTGELEACPSSKSQARVAAAFSTARTMADRRQLAPSVRVTLDTAWKLRIVSGVCL